MYVFCTFYFKFIVTLLQRYYFLIAVSKQIQAIAKLFFVQLIENN